MTFHARRSFAVSAFLLRIVLLLRAPQVRLSSAGRLVGERSEPGAALRPVLMRIVPPCSSTRCLTIARPSAGAAGIARATCRRGRSARTRATDVFVGNARPFIRRPRSASHPPFGAASIVIADPSGA